MATSVFTSYIPTTDAGSILVGARVFICDVGTTNLKAIYSDTALSSGLTNPMQTDADGFHPQAYLSGSYKIRIETGGTDTIGSGTLVRQWDNIDGGVPVGSGDLPIADGGTAASTAAAARTNLGVPSQTEVDDLSAELAELAGTVGSTGATQVATGTTAQRPTDLANGQFRRNTTVPQWEGYDGTDWDAFLTDDYYATQAEMETATSATKVPTVSVLRNHPGVAKAWGAITVAAGVPTLNASHGVTSITDAGVGTITVNLSVTMSSTDYAVPVGLTPVSTIVVCSARTTTTLTLTTTNLAAVTADVNGTYFFAVYGDI
jgi:hypothetical protein